MKIKRITITIGCILLSVVCVAQRRQIGDARTILKSGKNLDKAENRAVVYLDKENVHHCRKTRFARHAARQKGKGESAVP